MNVETLKALENQAWDLRVRLNRLIDAELDGHAVRYSVPAMKKKLYRTHASAYARFLRRQDKVGC